MGKKKKEQTIKKVKAEKVKNIDAVLPLDVRVERWMGRHFKHIIIASFTLVGLALFFEHRNVSHLTEAIDRQAQIIENMSHKAIIVGADGRVVQLEKQEVSSEMIRYILRGIIMKDVPVSAFDIKNADVNNVKELVKKVRKLAELKIYIEPKTPAERNFKAFVEFLWSEYRSGKLPEVIYIKPFSSSDSEETFAYQDGKFYYRIKLPVKMMYVDPVTQKWAEASSHITVKLKGKIDLTKSSPENPFGIQFSNFEVVEYVQKPRKEM